MNILTRQPRLKNIFIALALLAAPAAQAADTYLVVDLSGGTNAASYPVSYLSEVPSGGWTDEYKTTKLVLRKIPAGIFTMGSPIGELGRATDETQHVVTLTKDFHIGVFEVTQRQWELVMGNRPSFFTNAIYYATRPVEQVSYYDIRENPANSAISPNWPATNAVHASSFMGKLRTKTGQAAFDLPTESQWEYACRAGTTTALNSGSNLTSTTTCPNMAEVGRYRYNGGSDQSQGGDTSFGTAKAGTYLPNAWGLYDAHGNVWEWSLDWYGTYPGTVTNPAGPASGDRRSRRGGSLHDSDLCRSACRFVGDGPQSRSFNIGFRVAGNLSDFDTDTDGLSDAREIEHFGNLTASDGTGDFDRDGRTDAQEFADNTDPANASSTLGLVAYYPLDGDANDASGNGKNGAPVDCVVASDRHGNAGHALQLNGTSSKIVVTNQMLNIGQEGYTVSLWFNSSDSSKLRQTLFNTDPHVGIGVSYSRGENPPHLSIFVGNGVAWDINGPQGLNHISADQWHLVVFSKSGADYAMYVDGIMDYQINHPNTYDQNMSLVFGAGSLTGWPNQEWLKGSIDDIRVYNRALSSNEVARLYAATVPDGDTDLDGLPDAWESEHFGSLTASNGTGDFDHDGRTDAQEFADNTDPANAGSTLGLAAYYPFDGNANDASGNGNNGTIHGGLVFADGITGKCAVFNGQDSFVQVASSPDLNPRDQLTLSFWCILRRADNTGMHRAVIYKGYSGTWVSGANREYSLWIHPDYLQHIISAGDNSNQEVFSIAHELNLEDWAHIVVVIDRLEHKTSYYRNGTKIASWDDSYSSFNNNNGDLTIGRDSEYKWDMAPIAGSIDNLRIYNRAISSNEVARLYASTAAQPPVTHTVTLHPGDHGSIVGANAGSNYVVTVTNNAAFPAVQVIPDAGWTFTGWNPAAPATVTNDFTATAGYVVRTHTLTVASDHGTPTPALGSHTFAWGTSVDCRMSSVVNAGLTRYLCTGWTGTGSVPFSGGTTNTSFSITNDSSIVWQWTTNHWLAAGTAGGQGWLSVTGAWFSAGSTATVAAVAADGFRFERWLVDGGTPDGATTNILTNGGTNTLTVSMGVPHTLTAVFAVLGLPEALDNTGLAWTTGGASNWVGQTHVTFDGVDAAGSGMVSNNAQSWLETSVTNGGTLTFVWRVSSKEQSDQLRFIVDGKVCGLISGETAWRTNTITVPYGNHTFRWVYAKGKSGAAGIDQGWVDQVVWQPLPPLTLAIAVDATNLIWQTEGDTAWFPQTVTTADGIAAAQSGPIGNLGLSCLKTRVRGSGVLAFDWRVSCEEEYDWLVLIVDGVIQRAITGESGWQRVQLALGEGDHELRWEYWKDEGLSEGLDAGWLDRVSWSGAVPPQAGFTLWLADKGLSGDEAGLFVQDRNADGVPNGFEYAFGTNVPPAGPFLNIRMVNGRPVVETPAQDTAAAPYVDLHVLGSTNLTDWTLPVQPAANTTGKPVNRTWHEPQGAPPGRAFFKLKAELK